MSTPANHWSGSLDTVPVAVLGSLALGAGGRLGKHLLDLLKRPPEEPSIGLPAREDAQIDYPVDVTPEQARKLQAQGIKVKIAAAPGASIMGAVGLGAAGGAAGIAGWTLADYVIDKLRRRSAQSDVDDVRNRLKRVLDEDPIDMDKGLYNTMKTAEAIVKNAVSINPMNWGNDFSAMVAPLGAVLGAGLVGSGYGAYRRSASESRSKSKLSALRDLIGKQRPITPQVRMTPRLSRESLLALLKEEQELKKKRNEIQTPAGSPSQQADAVESLAGV